MKKILTVAVASIALSSTVLAQVPITNVITNAFDSGANYGGPGQPGWANGANAGFGFGAWSFNQSGNFSSIGNPSFGGILGMSTESFALQANIVEEANFVTNSRAINTPLSIGDTFSFQWGVNWDSGADGSKGFRLLAGGNEIANLTMIGTSFDVTLNGNVVLPFGLNSVFIGITRADASTYTVFSTSSRTDPSGGGFTTNISSALAADNFQIYASSLPSGDAYNSYYDNFSVTTVPEPSTYALLALSGIAFVGHMIRRRRR